MTPTPPSPSPAAVSAFLRGLEKRSRLFAAAQAGDERRGDQAREAVAKVFAGEAGQWPLAQWPGQYWRLLLSAPALRQAAAAGTGSPLPGISRLPPERRAAVLLHMVSGLDDAVAAEALGLGVPAYQDVIRDSLPRDQLGQPDVDVWRAWRAAAQRALEQAPEPAVPAPRVAAAIPATPRRQPAANVPEATSRGVRWLWLGVLFSVLAFVAAFFLHPAGREVVAKWTADIQHEALSPASDPRARYDAADIARHPDAAQLAAPQEAGFAREAAFLSWLADASADLRAADAVRLPMPTMDAPLAADRADGPAIRTRHWSGLSHAARGERRAAWQAWQRLTAGERLQLRAVAQRFRQLASEDQQALRERFAAQSHDARRGWWLGPRIGREWPRVAALFGFVEPGERDALLALLRSASAEEIDALARLAQSTPPEERAELRAALLAQPASQRADWLQQRILR